MRKSHDYNDNSDPYLISDRVKQTVTYIQEMGNRRSNPVQTSQRGDPTAVVPSEEHAHHPAWQRRMEELFVRLDRDKDGFVSMDDFMAQIDKFEKDHVPMPSNGDSSPELIQNLRSCMQEICSAMGLTPGKKVTKYEFIREILVYAPRELEKKRKGEDALIDKLNNAWYDAVGITHEGHVTLEEWRKVTNAWQLDVSDADKTFSSIDHENEGKISRKELNEKLFMFWFAREDEHSQRLFGEKGMFGYPTVVAASEEHAHHPGWQRRMEELFVRLDRDKDGFVSMDDFMAQIDMFEKDHVPMPSNGDSSPELIQNLRSCMQEICSAMGLTPGKKVTKYEFIREILVYAPREIEKKRKGEDALIDKLNNAWYDAVGITHEGHVTLEEWRKVTNAWQLDVSDADKTFSSIDHENEGKISRKELNEKLFMFWFAREDDHSQRLFGEKGMFGEN